MFHGRAVGREDRDAAVQDGRHAHVAVGLDRQRVQQLIAGQAGDQHPAAGTGQQRAARAFHAFQLAGAGDVPLPDARLERLRGVQRGVARGQPDAVRPLDRIDDFLDERAVRLGIVQAAHVAIAVADLAEIAEPHVAPGVEHDVVRPAQPVTVAMGVDGFARAGVEVHALDVTVGITVGDAVGHGQAAGLHPLEAAVVADVAFAVRTDRGAVRPASGFGHHFLGPVGFDPRQRAALDLGQDDAPVVHGDRAFGKFEARCDFTYCHTGLLSFDRPCCGRLRPRTGSHTTLAYGAPCSEGIGLRLPRPTIESGPSPPTLSRG